MALELHPSYGLVILNFVFSYFVHLLWMSVSVGKARKRYAVRYPTMYAPSDHKDAGVFNCIQRGHQNSLEYFAGNNILTLLLGLKYPVFAAAAGFTYNVARIVYFKGYSTGVPKKRLRGSFMYLATFSQLFALAYVGVRCLRGAL